MSSDLLTLRGFSDLSRLLDSIINVTSITSGFSGIFNNSLFQYAGVAILAIVLFGEPTIFE